MGVVFDSIYVTNINKIWQREQEAWSGLWAPYLVKSVISHIQVTRNTPATIREKMQYYISCWDIFLCINGYTTRI